ncbi:MAG: branched-chain amino acid aminotransferase [bacterium]
MSLSIKVQKTDNPGAPPPDQSLGFGQVFTDHMFVMDYNSKKGWHSPRIVPYGPFTLDPATIMLHYGQATFEGLKAFNTGDRVQLFRPRQNIDRMNRSNDRVCIPRLEPEDHLQAIHELVALDKGWVPSSPGTALYIRPTIIATEPFLGVHVSESYVFYIILSPVGAYYKEGFSPVKILVEDHYIRAAEGGLGEAKTPANYAASLLAAEKAKEKGFTQVLWLDGAERKWVEEVGTMNIFFLIDDKLITSPLTGTILPGVTRDSVIRLARDWNMKVSERKISIDEVMEAARSGSLQECFGTGTAAVISPVGSLTYGKDTVTVNGGEVGPLSQKLYDTITGIQYGNLEDPYGWTETVE